MRQASQTETITITLTENDWAIIARLIDSGAQRMQLDSLMGAGNVGEFLMTQVAIQSMHAQLADGAARIADAEAAGATAHDEQGGA